MATLTRESIYKRHEAGEINMKEVIRLLGEINKSQQEPQPTVETAPEPEKIPYPNLADIIVKNIAGKSKKLQPCYVNRASEIGHDCERYLVYNRLDWEKAKEIEDSLALVFNEGNNQEDQLLRDLQDARIKVKDLQIDVGIKEYNITGHLDCLVVVDYEGESIVAPLEIKSMNPNIFNSIHSVADFTKYHWTRKYYDQFQIYLQNDRFQYPFGFYLAKDKSSGQIKQIKDFDGDNIIKFNSDEHKLILEKAARIENYVKEKQYPDRIKFDLKLCGGCKFKSICLTDMSTIDGDIITDSAQIDATIEDFLSKEAEYEAIKPITKDYEKARATAKGLFSLEMVKEKGERNLITDRYLINLKLKKNKNEYIDFEATKRTEFEVTEPKIEPEKAVNLPTEEVRLPETETVNPEFNRQNAIARGHMAKLDWTPETYKRQFCLFYPQYTSSKQATTAEMEVWINHLQGLVDAFPEAPPPDASEYEVPTEETTPKQQTERKVADVPQSETFSGAGEAKAAMARMTDNFRKKHEIREFNGGFAIFAKPKSVDLPKFENKEASNGNTADTTTI